MKKRYTMPEYEVVEFDVDDMISTSGTCEDECTSDCKSFCQDVSCQYCYYLVCEPNDVIIN